MVWKSVYWRLKMNFNNYYLWPKKFVEETINAEESTQKPFVEEYTEEIFNKEIYGLRKRS